MKTDQTLKTPFRLLQPAGDRFHRGEPVQGLPAIIGDASGRPIATVAVRGTAEVDNKHAAAIIAACNAAGNATRLADALRTMLKAAHSVPVGDAFDTSIHSARATLADYDARPDAARIATATPAGEVPGIAGQWLPAARCAQLAPLLHTLLDSAADSMPSADWDGNDTLALRVLADDLECGARDPNVTPEPGDELPLNAPRLSSTYPRGLELLIDSQDVRALVDSLSDDEIGYAGLPMVDEISGALVRSEDGEHVEVWLTYSSRPFDITVARYTCVRA